MNYKEATLEYDAANCRNQQCPDDFNVYDQP